MLYNVQEDETPRTKKTVAEIGTPELTGTPEEIEKAAEIRAAVLIEADDLLTQLRSDEILTDEQWTTAILPPRQVKEAEVRLAQIALNRLRHQSVASWWIEHGPQGARKLLTDFMQEAQAESPNA